MKYTYNITFYYSPKGSLACKEGGRKTSHLFREEKKTIKLSLAERRATSRKERK